VYLYMYHTRETDAFTLDEGLSFTTLHQRYTRCVTFIWMVECRYEQGWCMMKIWPEVRKLHTSMLTNNNDDDGGDEGGDDGEGGEGGDCSCKNYRGFIVYNLT
jgi:hypothetical protein